MIRRQIRFVPIVLLALSAFSGCTQLQTKLRRVPSATQKDPVNEILCLWEASRGMDPDGKPARGFQGQIMFFTRRQKTPVRVSGTVVIEQYVSERGSSEFDEPLHTFRFDEKAWQAHLVSGNLGPTYNVFIPCMKPGKARENCGLRVRLIPDGLPGVDSNMARVILDAQVSAEEKQAQKKDGGRSKRLVNVSHESTENRRLRTTTIRPGVQQVRFESPAADAPRSLDQTQVETIRERLNKLREQRRQRDSQHERTERVSSASGLDLTDYDE